MLGQIQLLPYPRPLVLGMSPPLIFILPTTTQNQVWSSILPITGPNFFFVFEAFTLQNFQASCKDLLADPFQIWSMFNAQGEAPGCGGIVKNKGLPSSQQPSPPQHFRSVSNMQALPTLKHLVNIIMDVSIGVYFIWPKESEKYFNIAYGHSSQWHSIKEYCCNSFFPGCSLPHFFPLGISQHVLGLSSLDLFKVYDFSSL